MKRKVCVITGTRADYGLLKGVMQKMARSPLIELQVVATCMHLSPEFGLTFKEIEQDGFEIDAKIEMLLSSDSAVGVTKSIGLGLVGLADTLNNLKPDLVILLGDRFETLSAAIACHVAGIPIAHLHGGELTEGVIDDAIRHAITKLSSIHFVSAEEYRKRVIQLGEHPERVFLVGALGVDRIFDTEILSRSELEDALGFTLAKKNLLITFHPVTIGVEAPENQVSELLTALQDYKNTRLVFTYPNADTGGRSIIYQINEFVEKNPNAFFVPSLGQRRYFSCVREFDGVVGNSSSGIIEVPTFQKGTINIGSRQRGRVQGDSIINCVASAPEIKRAINLLYSDEFREKLKKTINPYGNGGAARQIVSIAEAIGLDQLSRKTFYDIEKNPG